MSDPTIPLRSLPAPPHPIQPGEPALDILERVRSEAPPRPPGEALAAAVAWVFWTIGQLVGFVCYAVVFCFRSARLGYRERMADLRRPEGVSPIAPAERPIPNPEPRAPWPVGASGADL